jgi:nucleoporin POM152
MMATPRRVTGSFPQTPATVATFRGNRKAVPVPPSSPAPKPKSTPLPVLPGNASTSQSGQPLIPLSLVDGPHQRLTAVGIYVGLLAWKFYDWVQLVEDNETSWLLFLKWIVIDLLFFYGLPELRIPWLELSTTTVTILFLIHAAIDYSLMFNIPVRFQNVARSLEEPQLTMFFRSRGKLGCSMLPKSSMIERRLCQATTLRWLISSITTLSSWENRL